ncbi:MAG: hypothetical protein K9M15_02275, partial [Candidatus Marinimicrobia bacterium]|nr:hypothetical protein [Candidatus Neomarinimicrobiota bacterium]
MNRKREDFYIKKVGKRGGIDIWIVDGPIIRRDTEKDFTNFGQHFRFSFIPKNEFWLDKEASQNERSFFIDHLLVENKLMGKGMPYSEALDIADKKEISERKKIDCLKISSSKKDDGSFDFDKIHKHFLGKTKDSISVWVVDGRLVRDIFDIDFTEGGHDLVYDYVPENEVWVDDDIYEKERNFVLLHELFERSLMKKGYSYDNAHNEASEIEWEARHSNSKLKNS